MNCQSFEAAVNDLARDQMMEAAARNQALAHTTACTRCAARLTDELALSAGLRTMAASGDEAPAHVEASLREAFRSMVAPPDEAVIAQTRSESRHWLRWAAAAAIIVVVALLALTAARLRITDTKDPDKEAAKEKEQPTLIPGPGNQKRQQTPNQLATTGTPGASGHHHKGGSGRRGSSNKVANPVEPAERRTEIASEFIPLVHRDEMSPSEGGQIVRVEMPRAALVSFGLPMNMERASERVKADVVVGNDGVARAIRFVH